MTGSRILLVDDEPDMVETCRKILERRGYSVVTAADGRAAVELARQQPFEAVVADLRMPGLDGLELLRESKKLSPETAVILITAYATIDTALRAVREGAFDYIPKPFSMEQLELAVERSLEHRRLVETNKTLEQQLRRAYDFSRIIGNCPQMTEVLERVRRIVDTDCNVLVRGESGTGKELIARSIHANGPRHHRAFVPIDCVALPETLLESELFGHERGAFTGAAEMRRGLVEHADGGTLFLDEIGDLTPAMQAKLLRLLQERQFRRVGGRDLLSVDVRVISATHRDLEEMLRQDRFREDLFYRLNVVTIALPPLRERVEDIPLLAQQFLEEFRSRSRRAIDGISSAAMLLLKRYAWPGNVRELRNAIERAVSLARGNQIDPFDLPESLLSVSEACARFSTDASFVDAKRQVVGEFERHYIDRCLRLARGNVSVAAAHAGMRRSALHRLMKRLGISARELRRRTGADGPSGR